MGKNLFFPKNLQRNSENSKKIKKKPFCIIQMKKRDEALFGIYFFLLRGIFVRFNGACNFFHFQEEKKKFSLNQKSFCTPLYYILSNNRDFSKIAGILYSKIVLKIE